jgi:endonuclease-3
MTKKLSLKQRSLEILIRLKRLYPEAPCTLNYETPVQLLVATILSAQCTDDRVNLVTPALFERFPDAVALANADIEELETLVRSTGFYRNKSKNIKGACQAIVNKFNNQVPQRMELLLELPGVARKTANVVLAHAFGINMGVTGRHSRQTFESAVGFDRTYRSYKDRAGFDVLLPQPDWENWSIRLVYHGRAVCNARNPACNICELADLCPSANSLVLHQG